MAPELPLPSDATTLAAQAEHEQATARQRAEDAAARQRVEDAATTEGKATLETAVAAATQAAAAAQAYVQAALAALEAERAAAAALERAATAARDRAAPPALEDDSSNLSDDDAPLHNEAALVAHLHAQAAGVQNIRSLVPVVLDLLSPHYNRWPDLVLLTLERYALTDHVLCTVPRPACPWHRMDCVVLSWLFGTLTVEL